MGTNRIKKFRKKANLTQQELANLLGISRKALSCLENGKTALVHDKVPDIARITRTTEAEILGYYIPDSVPKELMDIRDRLEQKVNMMTKTIKDLEDEIKSKDSIISLQKSIMDYQENQINNFERKSADKEND